MRLIWKVLRQHMSIGQLAGFVLANIIGLTIIVLGVQLYVDTQPILTDKEGFMQPDYLVVSKNVTTEAALFGEKPSLSQAEIEDLRAQDFVSKIGVFSSAQYKVDVTLEMNGHLFSTEMFFESVEDDFIDVNSADWVFDQSKNMVPIILPRAYLDLYNFGYAPTSSFPALSESLVNTIVIDLDLGTAPNELQMQGRVVGFSSRLNTILVPQDFMNWSNALLAPNKHAEERSRIIVQVKNPTDERIAAYFEAHDMKVEGDKLEASKAGWFVRLLIGGVMLIGLVICVLAGYVLVLSIFLLIQRNHDAIRNLRAIGYDANRVALPYQWLVVVTNGVSILCAMGLLIVIRSIYMRYIIDMAPTYVAPTMLWAWLFAIGIGAALIGINAVLIARSIRRTH